MSFPFFSFTMFYVAWISCCFDHNDNDDNDNGNNDNDDDDNNNNDNV